MCFVLAHLVLFFVEKRTKMNTTEKNVMREQGSKLFTSDGYEKSYFYLRLFAVLFDKMPSVADCLYEFDDKKNSYELFIFFVNRAQKDGFKQYSALETFYCGTELEKFPLAKSMCLDHSDFHIFINADTQLLLVFDRQSVCCIYEMANKESRQYCEEFLAAINNCYNGIKESKSKIECIGLSDRRYYLKDIEIKNMVELDVSALYNDDFQKIAENISNFLEDERNGLVILHGEQGTGKTSFIRHLISKSKKHFVYLPLDMASCLSDPRMITFICDEMKDAVVVIEDCEQLLVDRSESYNSINTGLVNILNMADGLLGDSLNLKFICTFNSDVKKIDKALLRKGRLVDKYEFGKLSAEKTTALMQKQYGLTGTFEPMTLAEIFNFTTENHGKNKERKVVGF